MHESVRTARLMGTLRESSGSTHITRGGSPGMRETDEEKARVRERNLRWMEALWEGTNTSAKEEDQKEEGLAVVRALGGAARGTREGGAGGGHEHVRQGGGPEGRGTCSVSCIGEGVQERERGSRVRALATVV